MSQRLKTPTEEIEHIKLGNCERKENFKHLEETGAGFHCDEWADKRY